jgi:hypothetical protein
MEKTACKGIGVVLVFNRQICFPLRDTISDLSNDFVYVIQMKHVPLRGCPWDRRNSSLLVQVHLDLSKGIKGGNISCSTFAQNPKKNFHQGVRNSCTGQVV